MGDLVALGVELLRQVFRPLDRRLDRQQAHLADVLAVDLHRQRLRLEAEAVAGLAGRRAHVALDFFARPLALGLAVAPLEIGDDALERLLHLVGAQAVVVGEADLLLARAVKDRVARRLRQLAPRPVEAELVVARERLERLKVIGRARLRPGRDRAALQRGFRVGNDERRIDPELGAEAAADRAGAVGVVEREQPRLDLGDGEARHRAGEFGGEEDAPRSLPLPACGERAGVRGKARCTALPLTLASLDLSPHAGRGGRVRELDDREPVRKLECGLETLRQPRRHVGPHDDPVDHHLDVVLELLVERGGVCDLVELPIDLQPLEAALHQIGDFLAVLAFPSADDRRQQIKPRVLRQCQHAVDHLAHRLALDRQAGRRRIGDADARPQEPHVVVDLGHRADGRARVLRRRLLLDGDRRRQAVDLVDVRLLHHFQELPGVGRQRLDITPLALGVDRVEGERRFARAGEPGEHDELVARDGEVDVLEIMLARPAHDDRPAAEQRLDVPAPPRGRRRRRFGHGLGAGHADLDDNSQASGANRACARQAPMLEQTTNKGKAPRAPRLRFSLM